MVYNQGDTIVSIATPSGTGALAVVRISGSSAMEIGQSLFKGRDFRGIHRNGVFYGEIQINDVLVDEVVLNVFKAPHSFTKENTVEISCHNSKYILRTLIEALLQRGARLANPGEFTQRAFLNGRFDLAQAEAVADLIASDSLAAHQVAMNQMRGGFSEEINLLREKLIEFASLLELEIDFGEEDVEFVERDTLLVYLTQLQTLLLPLLQSFRLGNNLKDGIPTVIVGKPNAGKSTLLNRLLNEERAIVSDVPGTTRDFIEDELIIEGMKLRLVDTAGLRETHDPVESIGVARTQRKMKQASLLLYLFDAVITTPNELVDQVRELDELGVPYLLIGNKMDQLDNHQRERVAEIASVQWISAKHGQELETLKEKMVLKIRNQGSISGSTIITNARHYQQLRLTSEALESASDKIRQQMSSDWLALDIRDALNQLGEITGEVTTDDLLEVIFSKFCIGK